MNEYEQLKAMLGRAGVPYVEANPNLTDNLGAILVGGPEGRASEFYFNLDGELLDVEIPPVRSAIETRER